MTAQTAAERQRARRQRRKDGVRRVLVDVSPAVVTALEAGGWLGGAEANDRQMVGDTVTDFLQCWAEGRLCSRRLGHGSPAPATGDVELRVAAPLTGTHELGTFSTNADFAGGKMTKSELIQRLVTRRSG